VECKVGGVVLFSEMFSCQEKDLQTSLTGKENEQNSPNLDPSFHLGEIGGVGGMSLAL
jgi:hypothetical protein